MFFQDLRYRKVHIILLLGVFAVSLWATFELQRLGSMLLIVYNAVFFMITFFIMVAYMTLKNKRLQNPFTAYFGLGDLLFYLAITPLFYLQQYVLFFIISMLFSVALFILFKRKLNQTTIPLAGFSAILLLVVLCGDHYFKYPGLTLLQ